MAAGWVKSLQCKSRAYQDVYHPHPKPPLLPSTSCRNSYQNLKDVVADKPKSKPKPKTKPKLRPDPFSPHVKRSESVKPKTKPKPEALSGALENSKVRRTLSAPMSKVSGQVYGPGVDPVFPSVSELPEGHPSRNVVEIIFHTRWGPKGFSGRVEMVFKVQNLARTVSRFEEYRDLIKVRAGPGSGARCVADGNEMMRFQCLGPTNSGGNVGVGVMDGCDPKGMAAAAAVCTYSGSGAAHESGGGGKGRRAMVVCRVIAGRITERAGLGTRFQPDSCKSESDSVSGENGELLVFDARAVLPCFLVIYKL